MLFERRLATGLVLSCDGGPLGRKLLPAAWTDRVHVEQSARLSYEVLVDLAIVMVAIAGGER